MKRGIFNISVLFRATSFQNFFHLAFNQGTNVLVALIVTPYLFQTLGEEDYGLVNLGLTVIMLFSILVNYGFHLNGPKRIALLKSDRAGMEGFVNELITTRLLISSALFLIVLGLIHWLEIFQAYDQILLFSTIILFNEAVFPMVILQGLDKMSWISRANIVSKLCYLGLILSLVHNKVDAPMVNFYFGISALIVNTFLIIGLYKNQALRFRLASLSKVGLSLKNNFQFFLSTIAGHVSIHGGLVILSNFVSDFQIGQYALAQRVAFLLRMIPTFIIQAILQNASRLFSGDKVLFDAYLKKSYKIGLILTFSIGVFVCIASSWIIRVVGGEYVTYSSNVLRLLAFIPFLSTLNINNMIRILVAEHKDVLAKATWITAIFMVSVSLLGSYYYGGYGLAIALLATEFVSFLAHWFLLKTKSEALLNQSIFNK